MLLCINTWSIAHPNCLLCPTNPHLTRALPPCSAAPAPSPAAPRPQPGSELISGFLPAERALFITIIMSLGLPLSQDQGPYSWRNLAARLNKTGEQVGTYVALFNQCLKAAMEKTPLP